MAGGPGNRRLCGKDEGDDETLEKMTFVTMLMDSQGGWAAPRSASDKAGPQASQHHPDQY